MDKNREKFMAKVMHSGFERAAESFSKLVKGTVSVANSSSLVIPLRAKISGIAEEKGKLIVLTTQIIGRVSGKSFLVFSEKEIREMFKTLGPKDVHLEEAFLLEIDNIMSASVISDLSNALSIEVYGDVPHLYHLHSDELMDFIQTEVSHEDASHMICSKATFHFDHEDDVHPQFIWKINSKVFDIIPLEKIVA